jgi:hypothetical protein
MLDKVFLRRKDAGEYLKEKFGFGSEKSLAKLACVGGGPPFHKAGRTTLYAPAALDEWALAKSGAPIASTSKISGPVKSTSKNDRSINSSENVEAR